MKFENANVLITGGAGDEEQGTHYHYSPLLYQYRRVEWLKKNQ